MIKYEEIFTVLLNIKTQLQDLKNRGNTHFDLEDIGAEGLIVLQNISTETKGLIHEYYDGLHPDNYHHFRLPSFHD